MRKSFVSPQFIKYALIGLLGTGLDFSILYTLVEYGHLYYLVAALISIGIVLWISFTLNKFWTFRNKEPQYFRQLSKYILSHAIGQVINFTIMILLVELFGVWYIMAKVFATIVVIIWNFLVTKHWVFLPKKITNKS